MFASEIFRPVRLYSSTHSSVAEALVPAQAISLITTGFVKISTICSDVGETLPLVSIAVTLKVYVLSSVPITLMELSVVVDTAPFLSILKYAMSPAVVLHENDRVVVATRQTEVESVPEQVEEERMISGRMESTNTVKKEPVERLHAVSVAKN